MRQARVFANSDAVWLLKTFFQQHHQTPGSCNRVNKDSRFRPVHALMLLKELPDILDMLCNPGFRRHILTNLMEFQRASLQNATRVSIFGRAIMSLYFLVAHTTMFQ